MNKRILSSRLVSAVILSALVAAGCADTTARDTASPVTAAATGAAAPAAAAVSTEGNVQPVAADATRLIRLEGAHNVRTFANLRGSQGPIPAGSFIRADDLTSLTAADRDALAAAGVTLDVDLRTAEEAASSPDALATDARFQYKRISLMGSEHIDLSQLPATLGEMYVESLATTQPQFLQVFRTMAAQRDGTVLFHCTAGKDRTGMVAATLLSLAGVPRADIVHNYAITAHYLQPMMSSNTQIAQMLETNPGLAALMGSRPADIEAFLDALERQYGGARNYLGTIGLNDAEVHSLLMRMGQARTH